MESGGFAAEPADFIVNEAHLVNRYRAMLGENNVWACKYCQISSNKIPLFLENLWMFTFELKKEIYSQFNMSFLKTSRHNMCTWSVK